MQYMTKLFKDISPKNDIIFKKSFGEVGAEDTLKDLLESILDREIKWLEFNQNTELLGEMEDDKDSRIDVCAELNDGTIVDIEMQLDKSKYSEKRVLHYWGRKFSSTIKKGMDYRTARKVISIWILDETVYPGIDDYMVQWNVEGNQRKV